MHRSVLCGFEETDRNVFLAVLHVLQSPFNFCSKEFIDLLHRTAQCHHSRNSISANMSKATPIKATPQDWLLTHLSNSVDNEM